MAPEPALCAALELVVNGEVLWFEAGGSWGSSVLALLEQLELAGKRVAVAVNGSVVPRSRFAQHALASGDAVEVIQAVGGG